MSGREIHTDYEMIEYAVFQEQKAYEFYTALSEWIKSPYLKQICREFAETEKEHKRRLELELIKLGRVVKPPQNYDEEITESDHIIGDPDSGMDYQDLLELAVEKERASYQLYIDLLMDTQNGELREVLFSLAEEELVHRLRFEDELNGPFSEN